MIDVVFVLTLVLFNTDKTPVQAVVHPYVFATRGECMQKLSTEVADLEQRAKEQGLRVSVQCNAVDAPR